MSVLGAQQTGEDGLGQEKTTYGSAVSLKAKKVTTIRNSTLKITGMSTGTSWTIDVVVNSGDQVLQHYPPQIDPEPPSGPVASFTHTVQEGGV
tara:strand:- start:100 stop:378 length:279 start_codon:yes stop_codon:yes gene_type:complete